VPCHLTGRFSEHRDRVPQNSPKDNTSPKSERKREQSHGSKAENTKDCLCVWLCKSCVIRQKQNCLKSNHYETKSSLGDTQSKTLPSQHIHVHITHGKICGCEPLGNEQVKVMSNCLSYAANVSCRRTRDRLKAARLMATEYHSTQSGLCNGDCTGGL